jgi:hypothetical protein
MVDLLFENLIDLQATLIVVVIAWVDVNDVRKRGVGSAALFECSEILRGVRAPITGDKKWNITLLA